MAENELLRQILKNQEIFQEEQVKQGKELATISAYQKTHFDTITKQGKDIESLKRWKWGIIGTGGLGVGGIITAIKAYFSG